MGAEEEEMEEKGVEMEEKGVGMLEELEEMNMGEPVLKQGIYFQKLEKVEIYFSFPIFKKRKVKIMPNGALFKFFFLEILLLNNKIPYLQYSSPSCFGCMPSAIPGLVTN